METGTLHIRVATEADAANLLEIYAPYVEKTAITFEYTVPSPGEFRTRIRETLRRYPYLVAEENGMPVGYAYAGAFKERAAYDWAVETSIYLEWNCRGRGVGRRLYDALEWCLREQRILNLNACIAVPETEDAYLTRDSVYFHQRLDYQLVGQFHRCGYKFQRWYDMVWMEKLIGQHRTEQLPMRPFAEIRPMVEEKLQAHPF